MADLQSFCKTHTLPCLRHLLPLEYTDVVKQVVATDRYRVAGDESCVT